MKKLMLLVLMCVLVGCQSQENYYLKPSKLSKDEATIKELLTMDETYLFYDYQLPTRKKIIRLVVETYKDGQLLNDEKMILCNHLGYTKGQLIININDDSFYDVRLKNNTEEGTTSCQLDFTKLLAKGDYNESMSRFLDEAVPYDDVRAFVIGSIAYGYAPSYQTYALNTYQQGMNFDETGTYVVLFKIEFDDELE